MGHQGGSQYTPPPCKHPSFPPLLNGGGAVKLLPPHLPCKTLASLLLSCALGVQRVGIVNELRLAMLQSFGLESRTRDGTRYTMYVQGRLVKKELVWRTLFVGLCIALPWSLICVCCRDFCLLLG